MAKAFYSLVQYCPNRFRAEAVNVGLVLLCPEPHALRVRITRSFSRVRKLFQITSDQLKNVKLSANSLLKRIEQGEHELVMESDLASFAASRANDFRLTEPRLAKIEQIDADFERLFAELVDERSTESLADRSPAHVLPPVLGEVFHRLSQQRKIWDPDPIIVPILNRKLDVPYAFRNGAINLIKPMVFHLGRRAETQAATLAIDGDLISKHPVAGEQHKLIVVSTQEDERQQREISEHIAPLFEAYHVRLIRPEQAQQFAAEVESSAH